MKSRKIFQTVSRGLRMTGVADFRGKPLRSFDGFGNQKAMTTLDVSGTLIKNFETLEAQSCLKTIIADKSQLNSFACLSRQKSVTEISFLDTPLSKTENCRLASLIVLGTKLHSINGKPVTESERKIAAAYPPVCRSLVEKGWIVQYPIPSADDLAYISEVLRTKFTDEAPTSVKDVTEQEPDEEYLHDKLAEILRPAGFVIRPGADMDKDIKDAVDSICEAVSLLVGDK